MNPNNIEKENGVIGRIYEDDYPVIYKFVNRLPDAAIRSGLEWLTVISWKYDGGGRNGMPYSEDNEGMMALESAIEDHITGPGILRHAYSRTGNNLKELVYYIHDQEAFLKEFNLALKDHPRYPIEIDFYHDPAWEDFQRILDDFKDAVTHSSEADA